jgi:arginine utilization protein RocB
MTRHSWTELLTRLVGVPSVTGSSAEARFPRELEALLAEMPYFASHRDAIVRHPTGEGREVLTALYRPDGPRRPQTVILLAHYDVVGVEDYGPLAPLAFEPERLTAALRADPDHLDDAARRDLDTGRFLFGRGVMDMKGGLASEITLLQEAEAGAFQPGGNLLLLAVPDEEVNSVGMRRALDALAQVARREELSYRLVLNTEPVFPRVPGDRTQYLYTGSMGKLLAGFYCLGQVTHVGESLSGLNANTMAAALTESMEWHPGLLQQFGDETTPPPTNLLQYGLSERYSVQIPFRAVTLTNILTHDRPLPEVLETLAAIGRETACGTYTKTWYYRDPNNSADDREFAAAYQAKYKRPAADKAWMGWYSARAMFRAIEAAQSTEPDAIVAALENWRESDAGMTVDFRKWDHQMVHRLLVAGVKQQIPDQWDYFDVLASVPKTGAEMQQAYGGGADSACHMPPT